MDFSTLNRELAVAAHRCWCKRMLKQGWRLGETFDPDAKVHDMLRPFDELTEFTKDEICHWMQYDEVEEYMAMLLDTLGRDREPTVADMRVGMRVRPVPRGDDPPAELADLRATVIGWTVADERIGRLDMIRLRWDDGEEVEMHVSEYCCEPVPGEEAPQRSP